jgi:peptidoglycan/LPS O-acetylase OafA/YrhL
MVRFPEEQMTSKFKHYPALDGLRGVSIILVLVVHVHLLAPWTSGFFAGGSLGVDVFFVVSGFLITSLLLTEYATGGSINLGDFYVRRMLRLAPALISVLLFTCVVALLIGSFLKLGLTPLRLASTVGYFTNWVRAFEPAQVWFLAHFWSLAIEEQFYLLWPISLILLLKFCSRRTILLIVIAAIIASGALKITLFLSGETSRRIFYGSDTRADVVLMGCLVAMLIQWNLLPKFLQNERTRASLTKAGVIVLCAFFLIAGESFAPLYLGGFTLVALSVGIVITHITLSPDSSLSRVLRNSIVVWIGRRSYGLYLWHWPVYELCRLLPEPLILISAIAGSFIVAALSYRFIESPFLRLKRRYSAGQRAQFLHLHHRTLDA